MMGVAGSGKTHVGQVLAARLGWAFYDGDDFHLPESIALMRSGVALTEREREPWLDRLRTLLLGVDERGENAVLACSALGRAIREGLREGLSDLRFVYLKADREVIGPRLRTRQGHFMPVELLESQYAALEEPVDALVLDATEPADTLVAAVRSAFGV